MIPFFYITLWLFGAIFWSFASAVLPRLHEGKWFVKERSECPNCHHTLSVLDLFPILSFVFLEGKCRYCKTKIPLFHVLLETSMVAMFLLIGYTFGNPEALLIGEFTHVPEFLFLLVAGFVSVVFTAYDLMYMEIPDEFMLPFLVITFVAYGYFHLNGILIDYMIPFETARYNTPLVQAMLWWMPIFLFFLTLILVSKWRWMWAGDLRIALFMGFIAGAKIAWLGIFLSYIVGSVIGIGILAIYRRRNIMVPFGPFLAIGIWIALIQYENIMTLFQQFLVY